MIAASGTRVLHCDAIGQNESLGNGFLISLRGTAVTTSRTTKKTEPRVYVIDRGRACWYLKWRDPFAGRWRERSSRVNIGATKREKRQSHGQAERVAQRLEEELLLNWYPPAVRSIEAHLEPWSVFLASRGTTIAEINSLKNRVVRFARHVGQDDIEAITADAVARFLADLHTQNDKPASAQTKNHYLKALKSFAKHLVRSDVLERNPLEWLQPRNVATDRRHERRPLTADEFARLIEAAAAGPTIQAVSGPDRAMLYLIAGFTGLRRGELASLTVRSFDFATNPPTVTVQAGHSKHRRVDVLPVHQLVVAKLKAWLADKGTLSLASPLFELRTQRGHDRRTSLMVKQDCEAAGVPYEDNQGKVVDFHALRTSYVTNLARAGVPLVMAQKLARHSSPNLTANVYTQLALSEQAEALAKLSVDTGQASTRRSDTAC